MKTQTFSAEQGGTDFLCATAVLSSLRTDEDPGRSKQLQDVWGIGSQQVTRPSYVIHVSADESSGRILFHLLRDRWYEERGITSSIVHMSECPSYLRIIGMGEPAVPLILEQLKREGDDPDHWFVALEAITGANPIPVEAYGNTVKMAQAWFEWADANNEW